MKTLWFAILAAFLLVSCNAQKDLELPEPAELFERVDESVELPEMDEVADTYLNESTGVEESEYASAVHYIISAGLAPDEIVIIKAKDREAAADIRQKLEKRLDYKEKSAENYLTEYLPVIKKGQVRRDGLTVSMIVSDKVEDIVAVYNTFKK
jgi:broad-specificity NMP kinase